MAGPFASEKNALGICDYCGLQYPLRKLKYTYSQGKKTGFRACPKDWSVDQPQNFVPDAVRAHGADAEALRDPRPQTNWDREIDQEALDAYNARVNNPNG
jgi:hypothetical protein